MVLNITSGTTIAVPWTNDDQSRQLVDQIDAMVARADEFFTYTDYLGAVPQSNAALIDEGWRMVVALWMISVVDYYNQKHCKYRMLSSTNSLSSSNPLSRESVFNAVTLIRLM